VSHDYAIIDPDNLTNNDHINNQYNTMALNTLYNGIDAKVSEQIKDLEMASEVWTRLEETYEGTSTVKSTKLYMLKDKFASFKIKDDESIPEMFYRLQVIVNDLKSLREDVKDKDFSHKFLMNLPKKFAILRNVIQREGLDKVTPNQVLGDVMTDAQYDVDEDEDEKKEIKVKQEKTTTFKASSSKGKSKVVVVDDDPFDEETMTLLVQKMGRFMKKRGYGVRKRRDYMKAKEMLCYNCKSPDHVVVECPYEYKRFNDGELKLKKNKKDKKEKKSEEKLHHQQQEGRWLCSHLG
jgi:hypothetical protein